MKESLKKNYLIAKKELEERFAKDREKILAQEEKLKSLQEGGHRVQKPWSKRVETSKQQSGSIGKN